MARIKFTGYIDTADLDASELDSSSPTGLSRLGMDSYTGPGSGFRVSDLEDLTVELS